MHRLSFSDVLSVFLQYSENFSAFVLFLVSQNPKERIFEILCHHDKRRHDRYVTPLNTENSWWILAGQ